MQQEIATILREAADRIASIVPTPTVLAPFKLEKGKKYTRRDGKIVGPLEAYSWHATATYAFHFHGDAWTTNGEWFAGSTNYRDLVAEYVEPAPSAEPAPFRLEVGKKYTRRDGRIAGPIKPRVSAVYPFEFDGFTWAECGAYYLGTTDYRDLVSEYVELVPAKPTPNQEQVDELVAAAWEAFEYADSKDLVLGRLACALRPFASPVL